MGRSLNDAVVVCHVKSGHEENDGVSQRCLSGGEKDKVVERFVVDSAYYC